ncbi:MAG: phosphoribosylpyrophosphate synthetase [Ginsengibacter sp.]
MQSYDTVTEAVSGLKAREYNIDFNLAFDQLTCHDDNIRLKPDEFEIVEVYRFEGESNPSDEDVVYAVESKDGKLKGVITSAFGLYADSISSDMIQKLSMHKK